MRIPIRELRIGSWVLHSFDVGPTVEFQVRRLDKPAHNYDVTSANFYSLPITGDILLRCGFKQEHTWYVYDYAGYRYVYYMGSDLFEIDSGGLRDPMALDIRPTSLHLLQNLIFALTGKELILQPK